MYSGVLKEMCDVVRKMCGVVWKEMCDVVWKDERMNEDLYV